MPFITDTLTDLTGGVSRKAPRIRLPSKAAEQINGLASTAGGMGMRPPIESVAKLSDDEGGYRTGLVQDFVVDNASRYKVAIAGGDLQVFDENGVEVPVTFPEGQDYLTGSEGFRAARDGKTLWITNLGIEAASIEETVETPAPQALIYIRQSDFGTTYTVEVDGTPVEYTTAVGGVAEDRANIDTGKVAEALMELLEDLFLDFEFERFGSTIHMSRTDGRDFRVSGSDGLSDRGMVVVKGSVQRFEDLPLRARSGFVCEVTGDPGGEEDNYWVEFDNRGSVDLDGVWREIAQPGAERRLDPDTMPHQLKHRGAFENGTAVQLPTEPTEGYSGRSSSTPLGWVFRSDPEDETFPPDEVAVLASVDHELTYYGDYVKNEVSDTYENEERVIEVGFSIATGNMVLGTQAIMTLYVDGNAVWTETYAAGFYHPLVTVEHEFVVPEGGADVKLELTYGSGASPEVHQRAQVTAFGTQSGNTSFSHFTWTNRTLTFAETTYPEGWSVEVELDSVPFSYTTPSDQTAPEVATGLAAVVDAHASFSASASGRTMSVTDSGTAPTLVNDPVWIADTHVYAPGLNAGSHVGKVLNNITDGSSGTIVDSGPDWVEVDDLTGGNRNYFLSGDEVEIKDVGDYFLFGPADWKERKAGNEARVPLPSFIGWPIKTVFIHEGRLGLTASDSVVLSQAGDRLNFFRQSARLVRDDDVIDIASGGSRVAEFHTAMKWDGGMYLLSDTALFQLSGDPFLSPKTVGLHMIADLPNDPGVSPAVAGSRIFFIRSGPRGTQVMEAFVQDNLRVEAFDLTEEIPGYITGTPTGLAVDAGLGLLIVQTDDGLFTYRYLDTPRSGRVISSWSKWTVPGEPVGISFSTGGVLSVLTEHLDGVYLGEIDLSADPPTDVVYEDMVGETAYPYQLTYEFSRIFVRGERGVVIPGDLRVQYVELFYHDTKGLEISVERIGRSEPLVTEVVHATASEGSVRVPIGSIDFTMTLTSDGPCSISSLDWEGIFYPKQPPR